MTQLREAQRANQEGAYRGLDSCLMPENLFQVWCGRGVVHSRSSAMNQ